MLFYFYYVMENSPPKTAFDTFFRLVLPMMFLPSVPFMISYEIVYSKKVKKTARFHVEKVVMRTTFLLVSFLSWGTIWILVDSALSSVIGGKACLFVASFISLGAFILIVVKNTSFFKKP